VAARAATEAAVTGPDDGPELPDRTVDEEDLGWGEAPRDDDPDDVRRFLDERPPHHDRDN
jgi:hypothetical protein